MVIDRPQRSYKRKRTNGGRAAVRRRRVVAPAQRGFARIGGYYGRFSGSRAGVEWKFHDVDLDDALISAAGTITPTINIIAQGVTESTRVGRKCTIRSIQWRYALNIPSQAVMANSSDIIRVIVYLDKQANGATAAVTDVLESDNFQSFYNLSNSGRFVMLLDRTHTIYAPTAIAGPVTGEQYLGRTWTKRCNLAIEYSGVNGTIGEIRSNNIGVLFLAKDGVVLLDSKFRLRFTDA